jgi:hypothetical protein
MLTAKRALQIILTIGIAGAAFSGYLTYRDVMIEASEQACTPLGAPGTILGYPSCVYGLSMYVLIVIAASIALASATPLRQDAAHRAPTHM